MAAATEGPAELGTEDLARSLNRAVLPLIPKKDGSATEAAVQALAVVQDAIRATKLSPTLQELKSGPLARALMFRWAKQDMVFVRLGGQGKHALRTLCLKAELQDLSNELAKVPRCILEPNEGDLSTADDASLQDSSGGAPFVELKAATLDSGKGKKKDSQATKANDAKPKAKTGVAIVTVTATALQTAVALLKQIVTIGNVSSLKKGVPNRIRIEADEPLRLQALHALENNTTEHTVIVDVLDVAISSTVSRQLQILASKRLELDNHLKITVAPTLTPTQKIIQGFKKALKEITIQDPHCELPWMVGHVSLQLFETVQSAADGGVVPDAMPAKEEPIWLGSVSVGPLGGWLAGNGFALLERVKQLSGCARIDMHDVGRHASVVTAMGPKEKVQDAVRFVRVFILRRFAHNPSYPRHQFQYRKTQTVQPSRVGQLIGVCGSNLIAVMLETGAGLFLHKETLYVGANSEEVLEAALNHKKVAPYIVSI